MSDMPNEKKDKKPKETSIGVTIESSAEELAQPRMAESAQVEADEQEGKRNGKPTRRRTQVAAEHHIEQYGTGTPIVK
jgi:hypothetical protein